jgi:hypothetical protein
MKSSFFFKAMIFAWQYYLSPPPFREPLPHIFHVVGGKVWFTGATFTRGIYSREGRGEGGVICETMPFNNGSSDQLQIQHEDSQ